MLIKFPIALILYVASQQIVRVWWISDDGLARGIHMMVQIPPKTHLIKRTFAETCAPHIFGIFERKSLTKNAPSPSRQNIFDMRCRLLFFFFSVVGPDKSHQFGGHNILVLPSVKHGRHIFWMTIRTVRRLYEYICRVWAVLFICACIWLNAHSFIYMCQPWTSARNDLDWVGLSISKCL